MERLSLLSLEQWKNIFRNVAELNEELEREGLETEPIEVQWLENPERKNEYVICSGCELFEEGFASEEEAQERLTYLENTILGGVQ